MMSLSHHLADLCEPLEAAAFHATQGVSLKVRNDEIREVEHRPGLYLKVRSERDSRIPPHSKKACSSQSR